VVDFWYGRSTPLIFLHNFGGGASAYEWSKVYPLATNYRVLAPDLIGWGESAHRDYKLLTDDIGRVYPTNLSLSSGGGGVSLTLL